MPLCEPAVSPLLGDFLRDDVVDRGLLEQEVREGGSGHLLGVLLQLLCVNLLRQGQLIGGVAGFEEVTDVVTLDRCVDVFLGHSRITS